MDPIFQENPITIVIVGHVDHGKSTFIGRFLFDTGNLTPDKIADLKETSQKLGQKIEFAHVMDQFREEREQSITIDTSQTFFKLKDQRYIIVDAPGHKEYLKNMITGATQAKNAFLLLDITEGIREQTDKHLQILKLLGLKKLVVLVNKLDKINYNQDKFKEIEEKIRHLLTQRNIDAEFVIPISAYEGDNVCQDSKKMDWYKGPTVLKYIMDIKSVSENGQDDEDLRFPVQLMHEVQDEWMALGRIESGQVTPGILVRAFPSGEEFKIKKVLKYEEKIKKASQGESVSLVIEGSPKMQRGTIICGGKNVPFKTGKIKSHVFWAAQSDLKLNDEVRAECRTQKALFKVESIRDELSNEKLDHLSSGDIGFIELSTKDPILLQSKGANDPFSRVVFHRDNEVAGCGIIEEQEGAK